MVICRSVSKTHLPTNDSGILVCPTRPANATGNAKILQHNLTCIFQWTLQTDGVRWNKRLHVARLCRLISVLKQSLHVSFCVMLYSTNQWVLYENEHLGCIWYIVTGLGFCSVITSNRSVVLSATAGVVSDILAFCNLSLCTVTFRSNRCHWCRAVSVRWTAQCRSMFMAQHSANHF